MSRLRRAAILAQAVSRLSPSMMIYMARRTLRNKLAPKFPDAYNRRISRIEAELPLLGEVRTVPAGVQEATAFYAEEYSDVFERLKEGKVCLYDREVDFGAPQDIDWDYYIEDEGDHQMWRVKLAHMGFICPMLLSGHSDFYKLAETLIEGAFRKTDVAEPGAFNKFWFPYASSHRILAIGPSFLAARAKGGLPPQLDALVAKFLRYNAAFVLDNIEYELWNNHVERNLAALCFYFQYVEKVPPQVAGKLERSVSQLLERTYLEDGTQIERSAMYQGLSQVSLAVMAEATFLSEGLRQRLTEKLKWVRHAFAVLCHPDGKVALFNDAWHGEVPRLKAAPISDRRSLLPAGGYGRLTHGEDVCIMDAGAIGPTWNPGHGHADFLSVEVTLAGHRFIVDPGTSRYNSGEGRARERSAAAHNGPIWREEEPVQFMGCFKVGRLAEANMLNPSLLSDAEMGGRFSHRSGAIGRIVRAYPGAGFLIADQWANAQYQRQVSWLVPKADWEVARSNASLHFNKQNGASGVIQVLSSDASVDLGVSKWANRYGVCHDAHMVNIDPEAESLITWVGHGCAPQEVQEDAREIQSLLTKIVNSAHKEVVY